MKHHLVVVTEDEQGEPVGLAPVGFFEGDGAGDELAEAVSVALEYALKAGQFGVAAPAPAAEARTVLTGQYL